MRFAECHPARKHLSKGLCDSCYYATYRQAHRERRRTNGNAWQAADREKQAEYKRRSRYGDVACLAFRLSTECDACREPFTHNRYKHVDHSHTKPKEDCFRGILCASCNHALGNLRDSEDRILKLWNYLERVGP